jgi:VanZ family protein
LLLNVAPALLYVLAVFYAGSLPRVPMPGPAGADKLVHLLAFAVMQLLLFRAVRYELGRLGYKWQLLGAAALASFVGAALEVYQGALPHRSAELGDWIADTVGALLAAVVAWLLLRSRAGRGAARESLRRDSEPQAS